MFIVKSTTVDIHVSVVTTITTNQPNKQTQYFPSVQKIYFQYAHRRH